MKNVFAFLACFFFTIPLLSQEKITIEFTDGTQIQGYGRIKNNGKILYRKEEKSKKKIYSYQSEPKVKKLTIHKDDKDTHYVYKIITSNGLKYYYELLKIDKVGYINLYSEIFNGTTDPNMTAGFSVSYSSTTYYLCKKEQDTAVNLGQGNVYSRKFRKRIAPKYFKDCPDLLDKINTREFFNHYGIESVVDYYNEKCE